MFKAKCSAGHISEIDFGEGFIAPCPVCGESLHKFRDRHEDEDKSDEVIKPPKKGLDLAFLPKSIDPKHRTAILAGCAVLVLGVVGWQLIPASSPTVNLTPIVQESPTKSFDNNIAQVSIEEFNAGIDPKTGNVQVSFFLTNSGNNDFPSLHIHWKGVEGKDMVIPSGGYPHDPVFTRQKIEFDQALPQGATGVTVSVEYPPKS